MSLLKRLWNDEAGFIVSTELILIATIVVIGLIVGLAAVRDAVTAELSDVAGAIQEMDQSYVFYSVRGHSAAVSGSGYADQKDFCDTTEATPGTIDNCIVIAAGGNTNEQGVLPTPNNP
ncbi:hypothetical protein LOC68_22985 [Blastopirellula sp. JC732]|uniref:Branched-chain amino acid aminotransferase n=1 Tax=Blastopirellula sediminis TaxID=2894196 RepID=A0A9X1MRD2_9BACT|nr:hypothetical protein [Blastopirellula sediminis]MCC9605431.1 hypothetical protein [Blastopirellula sediminis]MCC9631269.1 hypothetical protein [Blastopirellula sediminis]